MPELPPQHGGLYGAEQKFKNQQARHPNIQPGQIKRFLGQAAIPPRPPAMVRPNITRFGGPYTEHRDYIAPPQIPVRPAYPMRPNMQNISPYLRDIEIKKPTRGRQMVPAPPIRPHVRQQTPEMQRLSRFGMTAITDDPFRPETMPGRTGPTIRQVNPGWMARQVQRIKRKMRRGYNDELRTPLTANEAQMYMSDDFIAQHILKGRGDPGRAYDAPDRSSMLRRVQRTVPPVEISSLGRNMRGIGRLAGPMNAFGRQSGRTFDTMGYRG